MSEPRGTMEWTIVWPDPYDEPIPVHDVQITSIEPRDDITLEHFRDRVQFVIPIHADDKQIQAVHGLLFDEPPPRPNWLARLAKRLAFGGE